MTADRCRCPECVTLDALPSERQGIPDAWQTRFQFEPVRPQRTNRRRAPRRLAPAEA